MSAGRHRTGRGDDVFELLLPHAGDEEAGRAERVATFLRLLMHDAGGAQAEVVGAALLDARAVLDDVTRDELLGALGDLLVHYLSALRTPDSFLELPRAGRDLESAWGVLIERRLKGSKAGGFEVPGLPKPGESPGDTLARLVQALGGLGGDAELWQARLCHLLEGPRAAEERLAPLLSAGEEDPARRIALVQTLAAARLERGRPASCASLLLEESLELVARSPMLARQAVWALALMGRETEAAALAPGFHERAARLPLGLRELVARRPQLKRLLGEAPGAVVRGADPTQIASRAWWRDQEPTRGSLGASVLLWIHLGPAHTPELVFQDVAPDLAGKPKRWLRGRDGAALCIGEPEQRLLGSAAPVLSHRGSQQGLPGALDPKRSQSLALIPALDGEGEVTGWLHVECPHLLLPAGPRLADVRDHFVRRFGHGGQDASAAGEGAPTRTATVGVQERVGDFGTPPPDAPAARAHRAGRGGDELLRVTATAAVEALGLRLARRRWCWFDVVPSRGGVEHASQAGGLSAVAEGGRGDLGPAPGEVPRSALRALRTSTPVIFDEPAPQLGHGPLVRSGLALPLRVEDRVQAVLLLESVRARDLGEAAAARIMPRLQRHGLSWCAARFRAWHRRHFRHDVSLELESAAWSALFPDASRFVPLHTPLTILGPKGAGKTILARWLHFQRAPQAPRMHLWHGGLDRTESEQLGRRVTGECLVIEDLGRLGPEAAQRALGAVEEALAGGAQVLGLTDRVACSGTAHPAGGGSPADARLGSYFERVILRVPPLCDRRDELAPMCRQLLRAACEEEGLPACRLTDSALAFLWRQPWPQNVRGLEAFLFKLAALCAGREIDGPEVASIAERYKLSGTRRLPSRHPRRADLMAALELTAKGSGSWNKTRAALYLGWDPDTLVRRMADLGIEDRRTQRAKGASSQSATDHICPPDKR